MRPQGEIRAALLDAARGGPGTSRDFAHRAQVGLGAAYYTASRMVDAGQLVVLKPGKPALLALPDHAPAHQAAAAQPSVMQALDALERSFWDMPALGCPMR